MFKTYNKILIDLAKKAYKLGEVPVSALAVQNGKIIAKAHNLVEKNKDKTSHAEAILIKKLQRKFGHSNFIDEKISVYVTLQPCCMCMAMLSVCGVGSIFYLLEEKKFGGTRIFANNSAYRIPEIYYMHSEEYENLLKEFFKKLR